MTTNPLNLIDHSSDINDLICGVDEAGCGPLAGPVVAAAVILDVSRPIAGLADSKTLTAKKRDALFDVICENALAFHIASASVEEIDALNILQATMLAMQRAVRHLSVTPTLVKVDGNRCPEFSVNAHCNADIISVSQVNDVSQPIATKAIVRGDALVPSISAASILAKVTRDRTLKKLHFLHPEYGFDQHVGYPTPQHLAALKKHGPCIHHRHSFKPVRDALKFVQ